MEDERPGQASVQYGDVRGEAAGDVSDSLGNVLDTAARQQLGFKGPGYVVGVSIYGGDEFSRRKPDLVSVTFQVIEGFSSVDELNKKLAESGGVLTVKEYRKRGVPVVDFVRCFKRLDIGLFSRYINARTIRVEDDITIED